MNKCEDCKHWIKIDDKWGICPLARTGWFLNKPSWCKEGYMARHTQARLKYQRACKRNFEPKEN